MDDTPHDDIRFQHSEGYPKRVDDAAQPAVSTGVYSFHLVEGDVLHGKGQRR